jgi:hypothetical protein
MPSTAVARNSEGGGRAYLPCSLRPYHTVLAVKALRCSLVPPVPLLAVDKKGFESSLFPIPSGSFDKPEVYVPLRFLAVLCCQVHTMVSQQALGRLHELSIVRHICSVK